MPNKIFAPTQTTITMAVTTSNVQASMPGYVGAVRVFNAGPNIAFLRFGPSAQTAAVATDMPLAIGAVEVFELRGQLHAAAICGTGTATVYLTPGEGQ